MGSIFNSFSIALYTKTPYTANSSPRHENAVTLVSKLASFNMAKTISGAARMIKETIIKSFLSELSLEGLVTDYKLFSIVKIKILFLMNFGLSGWMGIISTQIIKFSIITSF